MHLTPFTPGPSNRTRPAQSAQPPAAANHAFTLVELTMVLVLVTIMVALIIPEMKGTLEAERLRANGRKLLRALNLAHTQTITLHKPHQLRLDANGKRFVVERPASREDPSPGFLPVQDIAGTQGNIDDRISASIQPASFPFVIKETVQGAPRQPAADPTGDPNVIAFYPDGTAQARELILEDKDGFRIALRINPITAHVQVVQLQRE